MHNKEQSTEKSTEQSTEQSTVQSTEQSTVQSTEKSTEQSTVQSTVQSNDTYIYGIGIPAVIAISVCVFCTYNKKTGQVIHEQPIKPFRPIKLNML